MSALSLAVELIKKSEGFKSKPYLCPAGIWTVGWGSIRGQDGSRIAPETPPITMEEGNALLERDATRAQIAVNSLVKVNLTEGQEAALIDFLYNLGIGNFKSSTLLKKVNRSEHMDVPYEFRKWVYGLGKKLPGLILRREREILLYSS